MAQTHVVRMSLVQVLATGAIKTDNAMSIGEKITANTEVRVRPKSTVPNSADYPTIEDYIEAEGADGFVLVHLDQTYIVTHSSAS